jgi:thioredoxin 1
VSRAVLNGAVCVLVLLLVTCGGWAEPAATPTPAVTLSPTGPEATVKQLTTAAREALAEGEPIAPVTLESLTVPMPEAEGPGPNLQTMMLSFLQFFSLLVEPAQAPATVTGNQAQLPLKLVSLPMVLVKKGSDWSVDLAASYEAWPQPVRDIIEQGLKQAQMQACQVQEVTDDNFEQMVLQAKGLVLVDFRADWCPWCVREQPVLKAMAQQFAGKVKVCSLDCEANLESARKYSVEAYPTLIQFRDGQVVTRNEGYLDQNQMHAWLQRNL